MTSTDVLHDRTARDDRWRALMRAAQDGDTAAYGTLLKEILPMVRSQVLRKWRNPADREDIVQDILLSIHCVRHTYDPNRPFGPWLATIAARRIADAARRASSRAGHETTVEIMPETSCDDEPNKNDKGIQTRDEIRFALAGLSAPQRQAIELMKLHGLSLEEASQVTGKSVSALKLTVHRAMKLMRQILE